MTEKFLYSPINNKENNYVVWMGFPQKRSMALNSLGYMWLYKEIDECEDINAEMICSDTEKTQYKIPNAFGFSFSFDFDFLEIFKILEKYNIPLKSKERDDNFPLIFAGGPVVSANPMPYSEIFDFFIIGDGEDVNINVIKFCKNNSKLSKKDLLKKNFRILMVFIFQNIRKK